MVAFGPKLRYFTDQNGPKEGLHENEFWVFSNSEWILKMNKNMNITSRSEKVDGKMGSFV